MKYSFHMSMCVCITTCFLYVTDAVSSTTELDNCSSYKTMATCNAASGCTWLALNTSSGVCTKKAVVSPDLPEGGVADMLMCSSMVVAMPADSDNCHANPYYLVTQPDYIYMQAGDSCTYNNNVPQVACYAGYYYYDATDSCKPCPEGFTSNDKNMGGIGDCYRSTDETFTNDYGTFGYESACYCDEDCEDGVSPESSDGC